jgi:hypothetical protein
MKQQIEFEPVVPALLPECIYRAKTDLFDMKIVLTDQILIPSSDGALSLNDFCSFTQVRGELNMGTIHYRSKAPQRNRRESGKFWNEDFLHVFSELIQYIDGGRDFSIYR